MVEWSIFNEIFAVAFNVPYFCDYHRNYLYSDT